MPQDLNLESVRGRIPLKYTFHPLIRWTMIAVGSFAVCYSLYFMMYHIQVDSPVMFKFLPVIIVFFGGNSVYNHLVSLNQVILKADTLQFRFILKRNVIIPWGQLKRVEIYKRITHHLKVQYLDSSGQLCTLITNLAFPRMTEIVLGIYEMQPNIETDPILASILQIKPLEIQPEAEKTVDKQ